VKAGEIIRRDVKNTAGDLDRGKTLQGGEAGKEIMVKKTSDQTNDKEWQFEVDGAAILDASVARKLVRIQKGEPVKAEPTQRIKWGGGKKN